ncbi:AraC family transcriptional regulator [Oceanobacillus sp. Castelsardo]|uniref:helix-turn-helix domain-containing protein n=1 Tax=Oceanobacillus sp. Castelsardo TaxID=1851204 RepID=UPI0008394480|nr:helix-turn-helix domain-containing protein [Oceanobacillus sp. Castelsardo]
MNNVLLNRLNKICNTIYNVTKINVQFIDLFGNPRLQLVHHSIPTVLQSNNSNNIPLESHQTSNSYYYFMNSYDLEYIATDIWNNEVLEGSILVGPFISRVSETNFISDIIANNHLPVSQRKQLSHFYESLPAISKKEYESIGEILVTLCHHEPINVEKVTPKLDVSSIEQGNRKTVTEDDQHIIERRYEGEKKLMDLISRGDKKAIAQLSVDSRDLFDFSNRFPESPIRVTKNILLVFNTLCRIATEKGGVHPVYLHHISEKYAIWIERATTLRQLNKLGASMPYEYCNLVVTSSTRHYNPIVKKAIDYILLHLDQSLTLQEVAKSIHVNSTYLSRKFKEETKMNLIQFIHYKRIEEAKLYLRTGNKTITEIAFLVGFNDVNYFTRVFKKITSLTPSQYMNKSAFDDI